MFFLFIFLTFVTLSMSINFLVIDYNSGTGILSLIGFLISFGALCMMMYYNRQKYLHPEKHGSSGHVNDSETNVFCDFMICSCPIDCDCSPDCSC